MKRLLLLAVGMASGFHFTSFAASTNGLSGAQASAPDTRLAAVRAVVAPAGAAAPAAAPLRYSAVASRVLARADHSKEVENVMRLATGALKTNRYTVVQPGLHWKDAAGNWQESRPVLEVQAGRVVGSGAAYQVALNRNLNTFGAVDVTLPDRAGQGTQHFRSHVLGLLYFDPETGQSVRLAVVQDAFAEITSTNEVIWRDAFQGIRADILFRYGVGRCEHDLVLRESPRPPSDYGLGPRTQLELISEIVASPPLRKTSQMLRSERDPAQRVRMAEPDLVNEIVDVGEMKMPLGRAFRTAAAGGRPGRELPVAKRVQTIGQRQVIIEAVEWSSARAEWEKLPPRTASVDRTGPPQARLGRELPAAPLLAAAASPAAPVQLAQATVAEAGFTIDWSLVEPMANYQFYSDQTYLIQGYPWIDGVAFWPAAVIKFSRDSALFPWGTITCPAGPEKTVLTAVDDDTVGEDIDGIPSTPSGYYGNYVCFEYLGNDFGLANLDLRYFWTGLMYLSNGEVDWVANCRFSHCDVGVGCNTGGWPYTYVLVGPAQMCDVQTWWSPPIGQGYSGGVDAYDVTEDCSTSPNPDTDNDTLPDAWEVSHFGDLSLGPNDDYDDDGRLNGQELTDGTDPNTIEFSVAFPGPRITNPSFTAPLTIPRGHPFKIAIVKDSDDLSSPSWDMYSPAGSVSVTFASVDGMHTVWVGLKGRPDDSVPTWRKGLVILDVNGPVLVIDSPSGTVSAPCITLSGHTSDGLQKIEFTTDNGVTYQPGVIVQRDYSEATADYGPTSFECLQVPLQPGDNNIKVRGEDMAGHSTSVDWPLTYSPPTSPPPAPTITWPPSGANVSGDTFVISGQVSDPTISVTISAPGMAPMAAGVMLGTPAAFHANDISLPAGTTQFTVTATDSEGHVSNPVQVSVTKSALWISADVVVTPKADPNEINPRNTFDVTVGTSEAATSVQVNGVNASSADSGAGYSWKATGMAMLQSESDPSFKITATAPGGSATLSLNPVVQPTIIYKWFYCYEDDEKATPVGITPIFPYRRHTCIWNNFSGGHWRGRTRAYTPPPLGAGEVDFEYGANCDVFGAYVPGTQFGNFDYFVCIARMEPHWDEALLVATGPNLRAHGTILSHVQRELHPGGRRGDPFVTLVFSMTAEEAGYDEDSLYYWAVGCGDVLVHRPTTSIPASKFKLFGEQMALVGFNYIGYLGKTFQAFKPVVFVAEVADTKAYTLNPSVSRAELDLGMDVDDDGDIDNKDERMEITPGAIVFENWDNDDGDADYTPDKNEAPVAGENDLVPLWLDRSVSVGLLKLEATAGADRIKVWTSPEKEAIVTLPKTWNLFTEVVPVVLYVEGYDHSYPANDVTLKLSYTLGPAPCWEDSLNITVMRLNLGAACYRSLALPVMQSLGFDYNHAGLVTGYTGRRERSSLRNDANWLVTEMDGSVPTVNTLATHKAASPNFFGFHLVPTTTDTQRNHILKNAQDILARSSSIAYVWPDAIVGIGAGWDGTIADIKELRCDGLVEVCYELAGVEVWGKNGTHYPIQDYAAEHNVLGKSDPQTMFSPIVQRGGVANSPTRMVHLNLIDPYNEHLP